MQGFPRSSEFQIVLNVPGIPAKVLALLVRSKQVQTPKCSGVPEKFLGSSEFLESSVKCPEVPGIRVKVLALLGSSENGKILRASDVSGTFGKF